MSLATLVNSFMGNQMHTPDLVPAAAVPVPAAKKAYNHRGYIHHEGYEDHPSFSHFHHHNSGYGKKKSRSVALSALTLLAFLFFLHILQQCIQDHQHQDYYRTTTVAPQVVIKLKEVREAEQRVGGDETVTDNPRREGVVSTGGSDLYQYGRVQHVPVKMTMVERSRERYNKKP